MKSPTPKQIGLYLLNAAKYGAVIVGCYAAINYPVKWLNRSTPVEARRVDVNNDNLQDIVVKHSNGHYDVMICEKRKTIEVKVKDGKTDIKDKLSDKNVYYNAENFRVSDVNIAEQNYDKEKQEIINRQKSLVDKLNNPDTE